jgi:paraquat-inducible protein B
MSEAEAQVAERRRVSPIWLVPIIALLLGAWMVVYTWRNQGPEVTIVFSTAEGIEAGKTKIRARSVEMGLVESVGLGDDLESVVVTARLERFAIPLLRDDTTFWVVRPRVGASGISGLGTLLSGAYIELAPGTGSLGRRNFRGLDDAPVTPAGTPGLKLWLVSERAGSVSAGDPILYKGFRVGRVESAEFVVESQKMRYGAFIRAPYDDLVTTATRFWNASGVSVSTGADGIRVRTGSLESMLLGGVAFGLPEGVEAGAPAEDEASFDLFADYESVNERPYRHSVEYVVEFARSVRGLRSGAPVEYRGIRAGRVERLMLEEAAARRREGSGAPIPVLIRLEPGRLAMGDSEEGLATLARSIEAGVGNGLRATLSTGSLLTGSLYVAMDMYPEEPPAELGRFAGRPSIPTIATGLEGIEKKVGSLLDKLNAMPLDDVARSADETLQALEKVLADLHALLESDSMRALPESLAGSLQALREVLVSVAPESPLHDRLLRTITELDRTLQSLDALLQNLEERPSSLLFSPRPDPDPVPPQGSP